MKLLGIDYGRRRIGLAVTDPQGICVRGLETIDRRSCPDAVARLASIVAEEAPEKLIFGIPLGPNEEETKTAQEVRSFARSVEAQIHLPIAFIEESFSSRRAEKILRTRKKKQRRDKANVDRIAACLLLQAYLEENSPPSAFSQE
jgi:putative Holliday junction resolvase